MLCERSVHRQEVHVASIDCGTWCRLKSEDASTETSFPLRRPVISDKQYHDALVVTLKYIGHVMIITLVQSATCTLVNPKIAHAIPQVMEMVIDGSFQGVSYINVMYNSCSSASITRKASRLKSTGNLTLQTAKCGALKARSTPCCWQHSTL